MLNQTYASKVRAESKKKMSLPNWKPQMTKDEMYAKNQMRYNDTHNSFGVGWGGEKPKKKK